MVVPPVTDPGARECFVRTDVRRNRRPCTQARGQLIPSGNPLRLLCFMDSPEANKLKVLTESPTLTKDSYSLVERMLARLSCRVRKDSIARSKWWGCGGGSGWSCGRKVAVQVWPGWLGSCPPKKMPCGGRSVSKLLQGRAGGHQLKKPPKQCNRQ
jgi:hypothetical protein